MTKRKTSYPFPPLVGQIRDLVKIAFEEGWREKHSRSDEHTFRRLPANDETIEAAWQDSYARKLLEGE